MSGFLRECNVVSIVLCVRWLEFRHVVRACSCVGVGGQFRVC